MSRRNDCLTIWGSHLVKKSQRHRTNEYGSEITKSKACSFCWTLHCSCLFIYVFVSVPHRACYSDHCPWSGQNIYLYPYLADKNDVDHFKSFPESLNWKERLERRVYKLFTGLLGHLTPHLSNCEPGQLVLVDKKSKFCQPILWSLLTIMPLYFGLSLLLFPLMSALVPCLQLIWAEYHNHWGKYIKTRKSSSTTSLPSEPCRLTVHQLTHQQPSNSMWSDKLSYCLLLLYQRKLSNIFQGRKYFTLTSIQQNLSLLLLG